MQQVFCERRQKEVEIPFPGRRKQDRSRSHQGSKDDVNEAPKPDLTARENGQSSYSGIAPSQKQLQNVSQARQYERESFKIPIRIQIQKKEISGYTHDISPGGLLIFSDAILSSGTPMALQFSFGDICYLNVSGQVVFCHQVQNEGSSLYSSGIKFAAIREWEQKILTSAVQELKQNATTQEKSLLSIQVSTDTISTEAAEFSLGTIYSVTSPDLHQKTEIIEKFNKELKIKRFTLLVNGEDLDTGRYEYYPYTDKLLTDRKTTMRMLQQLKLYQTPAEYEKYVFAQYCIGREDTNQIATKAAYEASQEFRYWPLKKRKKIMEGIHSLLMEQRDKLIELMVIEGHPVKLATWEIEGMEVAYRRESLDFYVSGFQEEIKINNASERLFLERRPDGVVCVIPPKNASCSNSLIAGFALLAGNGLIVKPPLRSPISTIYLWKNIVNIVLKANNAPKGILNIITGNSTKILEDWINSPFVDDILHFGDSTTGLEIGANVYRAGKKPILELSGNDLMFIWKDSPLDSAVSALLDGFLGSTQICMVPKKALIHEDIYDEFKRKFITEVHKLKVGLPSEPDVYLSPVLKIPQFYKCLNDALEKGAKLLCGGQRVNHNCLPDKNGAYITPAVLEVEDIEKALTMNCFIEENFFPLIPIVKVKSDSNQIKTKDETIFQKMVSVVNGHSYGLRLSVWVRSQKYIQEFYKYFQNSGLLRINSRHVGFSLGFGSHGGTRKSGGPFGEMNYIWQKTTHLQGISITDLGEG